MSKRALEYDEYEHVSNKRLKRCTTPEILFRPPIENDLPSEFIHIEELYIVLDDICDKL